MTDLFLELIGCRLPPVPEENQTSANTQTVTWGYLENTIPSQNDSLQVNITENFAYSFIKIIHMIFLFVLHAINNTESFYYYLINTVE